MNKRLLLVGLIYLLFLTACSDSAESVNSHFASPEYGVHVSFWWETDAVDPDLDRVEELGFGWVKQIVAWRDVENNYEPGAYDWYRLEQVIIPKVEERGLNLLVRIDRPPIWAYEGMGAVSPNGPPANYDNFGTFCGILAEKFKGRIQAYQVWNEPNLHREWNKERPNPAQYTELLKVCYEAIKAADPDAIVISAGLAPTATNDKTAMPDSEFLRGMYEAGAADYFDVLGLNAPGFKAPPDVSPDEVQDLGYADFREYTFRHVEDMRDIMVEYDDAESQVAILEMGWITYETGNADVGGSLAELHGSYNWFAVSEEEQAEYLAGAYEYARENWQPWIGLMTAVYFSDVAWTPEGNEQWWWSIVLPDGYERPAFEALKNIEK